MKKSLRRRFSRFIILSAFLASLAASCILWIFGELHFQTYYAAAEREGLENVRARLELFDIILGRAEREVIGPGRKALIELGTRFPTAERAARLGSEELRELAKNLGVGEIYFIDMNGRIFASSLATDIGLNLFALGPRFASSLKNLFGQGFVGDQRLTQSTNTGALTVYQYYSPIESDLMIEVSTPIDEALAQLYVDNGYVGLVGLAFGSGTRHPDSRGAVRMLDLIGDSGVALWSLLELGKQREEYLPLVKLARTNGSAGIITGGIEKAAVSVPLSPNNTTVVHDRRFAIIEIDRRPLMRYRIFALITLIVSCCGAIGVSFIVANKGFARVVADRVENLERAMARVAEHAEPFDYQDSGDDEISVIALGVDSLVTQVKRRAEERDALNARLTAEVEARAKREDELARSLAEQLILQREIHHRVKNNMQIILSLVGLQAGAENDERASHALESMRTRVYAMSLVLDRLYSRMDVERLPLDDFLRDFSYYLDGIYRRPGFFAVVHTDGGQLYLSPDAAVPLGLIVGELVTNSLTHAFIGRPAGRIDVLAAAAGEGFTLTVSDNGIGGADAAEKVGSTMVRALAAQLGAAVSVETVNGRTTRIDVPRGQVSPPDGV